MEERKREGEEEGPRQRDEMGRREEGGGEDKEGWVPPDLNEISIDVIILFIV